MVNQIQDIDRVQPLWRHAPGFGFSQLAYDSEMRHAWKY